MSDEDSLSANARRTPWNKGKLIGAKPPLRPNQVWSIRTRLLMGRRPEGWYTRYAPSLSTRAILLDAGYSYDSDAYDDELPYWVKVASRDQLVIPYSLVHNDVRFSRQRITTGSDYFDYIKNAVQCVINEDPPWMISFGLHNRICSSGSRLWTGKSS